MASYSTVATRMVVGKTLPLAYQLSPKQYQSVTVAKLFVPNVGFGDLVQVYGAGQVEAPTGLDRAMHARYLKATSTGSNSSAEGVLLDRPMGCNFLALQHYSLLTAAGSFVVSSGWVGATVTVMLVMYAANLSGNPSDSRSLTVKYVELRADVLKP